MAAGVAAASLAALTQSIAAPGKARAAAALPDERKHLAWVWQFDEDGSAEDIRRSLAEHGLGIILKTNDGPRWMGRWDKSEDAVKDANRVRRLRDYFESEGVPFHAWCVVTGKDPQAEAEVCAEVLEAGARSLVLDLEPNDKGDYWQGRPRDAYLFGSALRHRQPNAHVVVAPDPRPWQVDAVPLREFADFSNEIAPQAYWKTFNSSANYRLLRERGWDVDAGVTPELILDVSAATLQPYGLPIRPIGVGTADVDAWRRFVEHAFRLGMDHVSVWRYGVSNPEVWPLLRELPPTAPEPPPAVHAIQVVDEAATVEQAADDATFQAPSSDVSASNRTLSVVKPAAPPEAPGTDALAAEGDTEGSTTLVSIAGGAMAVAGTLLIGAKGFAASTAPRPKELRCVA
jgi:hypothetical protein